MTDTKTNQYWTGSANAGPEGLTSYALDITYRGPVVGGPADSGTIVTNKKPPIPVHADWPIRLGVTNVAPADLPKTFTWSIDGAGGNGAAAINGYVLGSANSTATVVALDPGSDTNATFPDPPIPSAPALFSYYYTRSFSGSATVTPQGVSGASVTTTFNVVAPTTVMTATYESAAISTNLPLGVVELSLGPPGSYDQILFEHPAVHGTEFLGHTAFVQVYTGGDEWIGTGTVKNYYAEGTGLDGTMPYGNEAPPPADTHTGDAPARSADPNYSAMIIDDSPTMWAMFLPAAPGSIYIPLDSAPWSWGGTETYNRATKAWTLTDQTPASPGTVPLTGSTTFYPTWTQILQSPNPPP